MINLYLILCMMKNSNYRVLIAVKNKVEDDNDNGLYLLQVFHHVRQGCKHFICINYLIVTMLLQGTASLGE